MASNYVEKAFIHIDDISLSVFVKRPLFGRSLLI